MGIGIGQENDGNNDFMFMDENTFVKAGKWWIRFDSIRGHIADQGSWARDLFAAFSADDQDATLRNIAAFALNLVDGLNQVQVERDSNNGASAEDSPPVSPLELASMRLREFIAHVLDPHRAQPTKF